MDIQTLRSSVTLKPMSSETSDNPPEREADAMRLRARPYGFALYYDI